MIVEKNVPLPIPTGSKYSFIESMEVGDSIDVSDMTKPEQRKFYIGMQTTGARQNIRFTKRGSRIWRSK